MKNIGVSVPENFQFLEVNFSMYLNRSVFVMILPQMFAENTLLDKLRFRFNLDNV